jgi:hypothetical protein
VHLANSEPLAQDCLDVSDVHSLAAFATSPSAVLYVAGTGESQVLLVERGGTRLRYVPDRADPAPAAEPETVASAEIPDQRLADYDTAAESAC